jgi:hypothetical protein
MGTNPTSITLTGMDRPIDLVRTATLLHSVKWAGARKIAPVAPVPVVRPQPRWVKRIPIAFPGSNFRIIPVTIRRLPSAPHEFSRLKRFSRLKEPGLKEPGLKDFGLKILRLKIRNATTAATDPRRECARLA